MANPMAAWFITSCKQCGDTIKKGEQIYFNGSRLCTTCAISNDLVCDCGKYKKEEYDQCYECHNG